MSRPLLLFALLLFAACATPRPSFTPTPSDTPPPDWSAALAGRLAWESHPDRALFDHGGRLGLYEFPGEQEVGIGRAAFTFADTAHPVLDGAVQLGLIDHASGTLRFLLPGELGTRTLTHFPSGIVQSATSGPFHLEAQVSFADLDVAVVTFALRHSGNTARHVTPVFRLRSANDNASRLFRWVPDRDYALLYQHHTAGSKPDPLFVAFAPVFDVTRAHTTGDSFAAADWPSRAASLDHPLYFTQSGRAAAYLMPPPRDLAPGETVWFSVVMAATGLRGDLAWERAEAVRAGIRSGANPHHAARERWNLLLHAVSAEDGQQADNERLATRLLMTRLILAQPDCGFGEDWPGAAASLAHREGPWGLDPEVLTTHADALESWQPDLAERLRKTAARIPQPLP